ncbi:adenylate/guanylate cyclase domain-containing protein [Nocardioides daeguensis]|uniref:Adenylate/guanylate cyclase domain-containing protein n=1 Tax=Nocardioides daeguensis TaxID=908359 RepID=A0ABP6WFJ1_9ACTN|nr:adenylate/guanylate cyclase domain-containing protein [Nocardioides daeguensis]MBV6729599.1 adenylate/guanylate cyclase domain-containing protein [Nocardioides daeguensis]MCR1775031.1 adenylate/guanylate cyclase domain-containing protein [Nocardioides daeguensis]
MSDTGPERTGEEPELTAAEVADQAGLSLDLTRRLFRTLGFAEHGDERAYTSADVAAMRILAEGPDHEAVLPEVALNVTRGIGITMARLADWEVGELVQHVADGAPENAEDPGAWVTARLGERFEDLLLYAWRRHLAAAIARMEAVRALDDDPHTTDLSVGFADIVGFTALSNEVSRERIGELVEVFEARCGDVIAREQGRLIKSMGDAVLFVNDDPMAAFTTAEGIINVIGRDPRMPDVRVGLATGGVVLRMGDVFGPPVNLAARLTQVARRNRIIVDHATADLLPAEQVDSRALPARPVRGFGVVEPVAVRRA